MREIERLQRVLVNYQSSMDDANRISNENQRLRVTLEELDERLLHTIGGAVDPLRELIAKALGG